MVLLASWKDFSITAQVAGWNEVTEFADGSVATGNGLGSMKVGAWWKIHSGSESNPTLDFSTTVNLLGSDCMMLFNADNQNDWHVNFVTAAWPVTSATQTISASSTITVPDGSYVVNVLGIRDDGTFSTTDLTAASGVTWESAQAVDPNVDANTTTGNDMSAQASRRKATTGGAGITLRKTATLAAVETGALLWLVIDDFSPPPAANRPRQYPQLIAQ